MKCLNTNCEYSIDWTCNKESVIRSNERCMKLETELDCLMCDLNEMNKCSDCCKDWNEVEW